METWIENFVHFFFQENIINPAKQIKNPKNPFSRETNGPKEKKTKTKNT